MSLKIDIEREVRVPTRIRIGGPGVFDVLVNGKKIYSRKKTGRLPGSDEVIQLIRQSIT